MLNLLAPQFVEERVESLLVDFRFQLRNYMSPPSVPQNIVIVEIDKKSLEKYGRWPWSRVRQAKLIDRIVKAKPSVLAIDIFYPERESGKADASLAKTLGKARGTIVMAAGFDTTAGKFLEELDNIMDRRPDFVTSYRYRS